MKHIYRLVVYSSKYDQPLERIKAKIKKVLGDNAEVWEIYNPIKNHYTIFIALTYHKTQEEVRFAIGSALDADESIVTLELISTTRKWIAKINTKKLNIDKKIIACIERRLKLLSPKIMNVEYADTNINRYWEGLRRIQIVTDSNIEESQITSTLVKVAVIDIPQIDIESVNEVGY